MLYQFIIKALMGNSDTIFAGLIIAVFGYMGWMLWQINEKFKAFTQKWNSHEDNLLVLKNKMDKIDEGVYKELMNKLENNVQEIDKLLIVSKDNNSDLERMRNDLIAEIKDGTNEVKDIIMILMNNKARGISSGHEEKDNKRK